jgi:hypothetical protein
VNLFCEILNKEINKMINHKTVFLRLSEVSREAELRTKEGKKLIITIVGTKANFSEKLLEQNKKEYRRE